MNCVELETPKGRTNCAINLLSKTKLTVGGSLTIDGLYQLTLFPTLICRRFSGENVVNGAEVSPPPACTLARLLFYLKQQALALIVVLEEYPAACKPYCCYNKCYLSIHYLVTWFIRNY